MLFSTYVIGAVVSTMLRVADSQPMRCLGDCNGSTGVDINELIIGVNIALDNRDITDCPEFDANDTRDVEIEELIGAVGNALNGCFFQDTDAYR
jgi:hypothetical protein